MLGKKSFWLDVMGPAHETAAFVSIDLSQENCRHKAIRNDSSLTSYISEITAQAKAYYAVGGYLEKRNFYESKLFADSEKPRNIHLGIDIWADRHTPIYAPIEGVIHSYAYNDLPLDYGYTLILQHEVEGEIVHSLYGHLSSSHIHKWQNSKAVTRGELIGHIGPRNENGGWVPHLHLQLIRDMEGYKGDYPGVCRLDDLSHYRNNCLDPLSKQWNEYA